MIKNGAVIKGDFGKYALGVLFMLASFWVPALWRERASDRGPQTPPSSASTHGVTSDCDNHEITHHESFIRASDALLSKKEGFVFRRNGISVMVSLVRKGKRRPWIEVGPDEKIPFDKTEDRGGFYIKLREPGKATVSFCPKDPSGNVVSSPVVEAVAVASVENAAESLSIRAIELFSWSTPRMTDSNSGRSFGSEFCDSDKYIGMKVSCAYPQLSRTAECQFTARVLDARGNLLWSENHTAWTKPGQEHQEEWLNTTFPVNRIVIGHGEVANLSVEVWMGNRFLVKAYFTIHDCSPQQPMAEAQPTQSNTLGHVGLTLTERTVNEEKPTFTLDEEPCVTKRTGSYCFTNNSSVEVRVGGLRKCSPPCPLVIGPGQTQCYEDLPVGSRHFQISGYKDGGNRRVAEGDITIVQCGRGSYVHTH